MPITNFTLYLAVGQGGYMWRGDSLGLTLPKATSSFVIAWFFLSLVNLWLGVTTAGYTVLEELPIFLLIFLVPSVLAVLFSWRERARAKRLRADGNT